MPVLAITGQAPRTARGAHYQQELNLDRMFADVADYRAGSRGRRRRCAISSIAAIRIAMAENGVAVLVLPDDLQDKPYEDPPRQHGAVRSGVGYSRPRVVPTRPTCAAPPRC